MLDRFRIALTAITVALAAVSAVNSASAATAIEYGLVTASGYSASTGGDRPTESLSLNFTRIMFHIGP